MYDNIMEKIKRKYYEYNYFYSNLTPIQESKIKKSWYEYFDFKTGNYIWKKLKNKY